MSQSTVSATKSVSTCFLSIVSSSLLLVGWFLGEGSLTILEIRCLRVLSSSDNGELDLFEHLSLDASALLQPLLGIDKCLALEIVLVYSPQD